MPPQQKGPQYSNLPPGYRWDPNSKLPVPIQSGSQRRQSVGEVAARRQDAARNPSLPNPYLNQPSLARTDSVALKQIAPVRADRQGSEKERAQQRLNLANDPNVPPELKPYQPGSQSARTDSLVIGEPLGEERAADRRKRTIAEGKRKRSALEGDRKYVKGLTDSISKINNQLRGTTIDANDMRQPDYPKTLPDGSINPERAELENKLDIMRQERNDFREGKKREKAHRAGAKGEKWTKAKWAKVKLGDYWWDDDNVLRGPRK